MSELEDIWHDQEQYKPINVARQKRENERLYEKLEEAKSLLSESVARYPVEQDPNLWTSRVRAWLEKYNG